MKTLEAKLKRIVLGDHEDGTPAYLEKRELNEILTAVTEWAEEAFSHPKIYGTDAVKQIISNLNSSLREEAK